MGTNYYAIRIKTKKEWEEKRTRDLDLVKDSSSLTEAVTFYYEEKKPKEIHIGKSSGGWQFCFNYNKGEYYTNILELMDFLSECEISNEYGQTFGFKEFLGDVVQGRMWNGKPGERQAGKYEVFDLDGYDFLDCEFS